MSRAIPVVDIFSGPGGLAEGFARCKDYRRRVRFEVKLSVEMERSAYKTLLLRAFIRKFGEGYPPEYISFLNQGATSTPDWLGCYPKEWTEAVRETQQWELGTSEAKKKINERIKYIRNQHGGRSVLLGGPPCQSYSLVGRARNAGNSNYDPAKDKRQSLYAEFARILGALRPAVAVMENVKGILSARNGEELIIKRVLMSLRDAAGADSYRLYAVTGSGSGYWEEDKGPHNFLVRSEEHGVPQSRHRVIVVCVRSDIDEALPVSDLLRLSRRNRKVVVMDVIGDMPRLRSRISRGDSPEAWRDVIIAACDKMVNFSMPNLSSDERSCFRSEIRRVRESVAESVSAHNKGFGRMGVTCSNPLRNWICDARLNQIPNHEPRGHIPGDIWRYLFASSFAKATGRSPKSKNFPEILAPNHANWRTGKFSDRFRVQLGNRPSSTITSHISKDGHYFIHPDPTQCRSLTVREAARLQTFPDNYCFMGGRTQQYVQVGNAVPPFLALQIARCVANVIVEYDRTATRTFSGTGNGQTGVIADRATAEAVTATLT